MDIFWIPDPDPHNNRCGSATLLHTSSILRGREWDPTESAGHISACLRAVGWWWRTRGCWLAPRCWSRWDCWRPRPRWLAEHCHHRPATPPHWIAAGPPNGTVAPVAATWSHYCLSQRPDHLPLWSLPSRWGLRAALVGHPCSARLLAVFFFARTQPTPRASEDTNRPARSERQQCQQRRLRDRSDCRCLWRTMTRVTTVWTKFVARRRHQWRLKAPLCCCCYCWWWCCFD